MTYGVCVSPEAQAKKELAPHQQRVVTEKEELDTRLGALTKFLSTEVCFALPFDERSLLKQQADVMGQLSSILGQRIDIFKAAA